MRIWQRHLKKRHILNLNHEKRAWKKPKGFLFAIILKPIFSPRYRIRDVLSSPAWELVMNGTQNRFINEALAAQPQTDVSGQASLSQSHGRKQQLCADNERHKHPTSHAS